MLHVVIATRNPHKARELTRLLAGAPVAWHSLGEFPWVGALPERGNTFRANAAQKAMAAARATGYLALADDSGLEIEALGGAPGVRSARFAGHRADDEANTRKVLRALRRLDRGVHTACYRCVLVLADAERVLVETQGALRGRMVLTPAGHGGFGYDPIFFVPRLGKTLAQVPLSRKNRISHRAVAARRMRQALQLRASALAPATVPIRMARFDPS